MGFVKMYATTAPIGDLAIAGVQVAKEGDAFLVPVEHSAEIAKTFGLGFERPDVEPAAPAPQPEKAPAPRVLSDDVADAAAGETPSGPRNRGRR
jgi:hypothetical protein